MNRIYLIVTLAALCFLSIHRGALVWADGPPTLQEFSTGRVIDLKGDGPLFSFALPDDVYETVTTPFASDVRVFDGNGHVAPFEVRNTPSQDETVLTKKPVPIFPINTVIASEISKSLSAAEGKIYSNSEGNIVAVQMETQKKPTQRSYLLDLREVKDTITALELDWSTNDERLVPVTIESSFDLRYWVETVSEVLAHLDYLGHQIDKKSIQCNCSGGGYLKVSLPIDSAIHSVIALTTHTSTPEIKATRTKTVLPKMSQSKAVYEYDVGGRFPVQAVALNFETPNILLDVSLLSRNKEDAPWVMRYEGAVYKLTTDGQSLDALKIDVPLVSDRFWKIKTINPESVFPSPPTIKISWEPQQAYLFAQGAGPFTLAYGSAIVQGAMSEMLQAIPSLSFTQKIYQASLSSPHELAGEKALHLPTPPKPAEWKKWLLWTVLLVVLLSILGMAIGLSKELQKNS